MRPELVYATEPEISFEGKRFCFAGKFDGYERSELERFVKNEGALFFPNVDERTEFLVIGSKAIRCCSFACCVRVVEKAMVLQKNGAPIQLIREADFVAEMVARKS